MIVFDASVLTIAFDSSAKVPSIDGRPVEKCKERVDYLIEELNEAKEKIIIPTPVLAEYLVKAGKEKDARLNEFLRSGWFKTEPFCRRAAIACANMEILTKAQLKDENATKAKVKFDRQIVAIAKIWNVKAIYTGDIGLAATAKSNGIVAIMSWELPLPHRAQADWIAENE